MAYDPDQFIPKDAESVVDNNLNEEIEFYECQKCGEYNVLKNAPKTRRMTSIRHIRVDEVTWASLQRFKRINGIDLNYALLLLLMNAKTPNINYVLNPRVFVDKKKLAAKKRDEENNTDNSPANK